MKLRCLVFSEFPIHRVLFEVSIDRGAYGGMETLGTEALEQPEAFQLVLDRVLHFGEPQLDARLTQGLLELGEHVG